ncbi:MAG: pyridoxamine 5'-phosphate oxidase family protein, partial [candidate division Zixibacteria bacterium]|nr:pyridoxamine 5'-phosphate oxidase family protein [candidate division Zixibacteria bacterium]
MRRHEYTCDDPDAFAAIVNETSIGNLGIVTPDGYPRVVPVNFAVIGETVYFHG